MKDFWWSMKKLQGKLCNINAHWWDFSTLRGMKFESQRATPKNSLWLVLLPTGYLSRTLSSSKPLDGHFTGRHRNITSLGLEVGSNILVTSKFHERLGLVDYLFRHSIVKQVFRLSTKTLWAFAYDMVLFYNTRQLLTALDRFPR